MSPLKKTAKKSAKKPAEKAPPRKAPAKAPAKKEAPARKKPAATARPEAPAPPPPREARRERPRKRKAPGGSHAVPSASASSKPGLGNKWTCYHCQVKFYDLNKPVPLCPKCGSDQREAPKVAPTPPPADPPRPRAPASTMPASLLEEDEATVEDFEADGAEFDIGPIDDEAEPEGDDDFLGTEEPLEEEVAEEE